MADGRMLSLGLYVAAASFLFLMLVAVDMVRAVRRQELWFPCRWMTINAATLAFMAAASRMPNDVEPGLEAGGVLDRLAKLSGLVLLCCLMGFAMPSVAHVIHPANRSVDKPVRGDVPSGHLLGVLVGLAVLLGTSLVHVCVQLADGSLRTLMVENILVICATFIAFVLLCVLALGAYATDDILAMEALGLMQKFTKCDWDSMEEIVESACFIARTGSKSYVAARSYIGLPSMGSQPSGLNVDWVLWMRRNPRFHIPKGQINSHHTSSCRSMMGVLVSLCTLVLVEAMFRTLGVGFALPSPYGWTVCLVFGIQCVTIMLCWVACLIRWWRPIIYGEQRTIALEDCWKVEAYWESELRQTKRVATHKIGHVQIRLSWIWYVLTTAALKALLCLQRAAVCMCKMASALSQKCRTCANGKSEDQLRLAGYKDDYVLSKVVCLAEHEDPKGIFLSNVHGMEMVFREVKEGQSGKKGNMALVNLLTKYTSSESLKRLLHTSEQEELRTEKTSLAAASLLTILKALEYTLKECGKDGHREEAVEAFKAYYKARRWAKMVEDAESRGARQRRVAAFYVLAELKLSGRWLGVQLRRPYLLRELDKEAAPLPMEAHARAAETLDLLCELGKKKAADRFVGNSLHHVCSDIRGSLNHDPAHLLDSLLASILRRLADIIAACMTNLPAVVYDRSERHACGHDPRRCFKMLKEVHRAVHVRARLPSPSNSSHTDSRAIAKGKRHVYY